MAKTTKEADERIKEILRQNKENEAKQDIVSDEDKLAKEIRKASRQRTVRAVAYGAGAVAIGGGLMYKTHAKAKQTQSRALDETNRAILKCQYRKNSLHSNYKIQEDKIKDEMRAMYAKRKADLQKNIKDKTELASKISALKDHLKNETDKKLDMLDTRYKNKGNLIDQAIKNLEEKKARISKSVWNAYVDEKPKKKITIKGVKKKIDALKSLRDSVNELKN